MKRHAYLIIAHHHFDMLKNLIRALDSEHADFYIHINRSVRDLDEADILSAAKKSRARIFRRYRITWGADTQIRCELYLMEQAAKERYDYYHLLSGVDIPLKTGSEIEAFFEAQDKSFLEVKQEKDLGATLDRVRRYAFFQPLIGRQKAGRGKLYALLDQLAYESDKLQRMLKIDRTKNAPFAYCRGGNWFSITHALLAYILTQRPVIRKYFYHSVTADELFVQSVAMASPLRDEIIRDNLRLVDWTRTEHGGCSPHTFTSEDEEMLVSCRDKLFARKFDPAIDREIIERMYARIGIGGGENSN
ncbi:MAG: hypothetical protein IJN79_10140 [Clostridia bacterium]|nr:hypothetical protein [Clostridia bacterium]